jgi:hypothetical protein
MTTKTKPKKVELEWQVLECVNEQCKGFTFRWPYRADEDDTQKLCPSCMGAGIPIPRKKSSVS